MKHTVIATAGHVDHGKTQLTLALTGTDTDTLKEEKRRGMTIEPGYARLVINEELTLSIVDVPGHEQFIKNMLSGASGVDAVLLCVAADSGFMPQTREHLMILSLLGIERGIIALTKTDAADGGLLSAAIEDIKENTKGTFLENASIVPVSAYELTGIDELKAELVLLAKNTPQREIDKPFAMNADRVFTLDGAGVIATGTVGTGTVKAGDRVMVYPGEKTARVRCVQNHSVTVDAACAGMRAALNLTGEGTQLLSRGSVVAAPNAVNVLRSAVVCITLDARSPYEVKNASALHFYTGTQQCICKVRLLCGDVLRPNERTYALLTFDRDIFARPLDRFVLRFFSPVTTVGGGVIIDVHAKKLKRNDAKTLLRLEELSGEPQKRIFRLIEDRSFTPVSEDALAADSGLGRTDVQRCVSALEKQGCIVRLPDGVISKNALDAARKSAVSVLHAFHEQNPLSQGMNLSTLRARAGIADTNGLIDHFVSENILRVSGADAALYGFCPAPSKEQTTLMQSLDAFYLSAGLMPCALDALPSELVSDKKLFDAVFSYMIDKGALIALTPYQAVHISAFERAKAVFSDMFRDKSTVTLAEYRTALGVSRRFAQMYLERFDSMKISKLVLDARVLIQK